MTFSVCTFHSLCYSSHSLGAVSILQWVEITMRWLRKAVPCTADPPPSLYLPSLLSPCVAPSQPRLRHEKVKMGCGIGCHSARLSHRPHRMPFRVPQSNNCCVLLQREMGSERALWMFLLNHAECVTIGQEDKRTKGKPAAQMLLLRLTAQVHRNNPMLLFTSLRKGKHLCFLGGEICPEIC